MNRMLGYLLAGFLLLLEAMPAASAADPGAWPARPIHLLVPAGVGGVVDTRARWLADRLARALGTQVVVENKPGAGGNIGMQIAARSAPDGYTLVAIHQGVMTVNPHLYRSSGYDPLADFTPVISYGFGALLLAVHPDVRATSVRELIGLAKAAPGRLAFGSPGVGTPPHLAGELFKRAAGIDVQHIPYKGGGQAAGDLIAGHVAFSIEGITVQLPLVQGHRVRALAVTGPRRESVLADVPTMAEAGLPAAQFLGWAGFAVPARTPQPIVARFHREIGAILASAEGREWLHTNGIEPVSWTPEEFAAAIRAEHAKWGVVVREAGLRVDP